MKQWQQQQCKRTASAQRIALLPECACQAKHSNGSVELQAAALPLADEPHHQCFGVPARVHSHWLTCCCCCCCCRRGGHDGSNAWLRRRHGSNVRVPARVRHARCAAGGVADVGGQGREQRAAPRRGWCLDAACCVWSLWPCVRRPCMSAAGQETPYRMFTCCWCAAPRVVSSASDSNHCRAAAAAVPAQA